MPDGAAAAPLCSRVRPLLRQSWRGSPTTSAPCTGLSRHEISAHRRQSPDRAGRGVRAQVDQLLTRAFAVAKGVSTETAVGSSSVSIASVAVELAKKIFGSLNGKSVYLVGAGKMSELAARHLLAHGATS